MQPLNSFANHVGGLTTQTVEARTHRFHSRTFGIGQWNASAKPAKFLLCYPTLLSASGGHPHSALTASVNDRKTPLRFKIQNVGVRNQFSSQRINNLNHVIAQDKFWSQPEDVNHSNESRAQRQFENRLAGALRYPETICAKESDQDNGSSRPSKVTSRSKGFIHHLSIAGEGK
jgi:hypothetical protein